jgi:ABC-type transporter Mla subunit MlaD
VFFTLVAHYWKHAAFLPEGAPAGRDESPQVQPVLNQTNGQVDELLGALDDLQAQLTSLTDPVADIRHTVAGDREELARILTRAQHIADDVRRARESARSGADNVAGPNR